MSDSNSGGFFGGLATGFSEQQAAELAQQKQDAIEKQQAMVTAQGQIDSTIQHIAEIAKANAEAGRDNKGLFQNPAIQTLVQSAQAIAGKIGMDPARIAALAESATLRPPAAEKSKYSVVKTGSKTDTLGGSVDTYHVIDQNTGELKPVAPGAPVAPSAGPTAPQPKLPPSDTLSPAEISRANPAPQASGGPSIPATPASLVAQRFPEAPAPAPVQPTPTLPPDIKPGPEAIDYAISNNVHGPEFMKALPPSARNTTEGLLDYKVDPDKLSKRVDKSGQSEYTRFLGFARQASNGEYDPKYYKSMQASIKEFTAGGSTSPAYRIETANKAIAHGGEVADAIDKLAAVPGLLDRIAKSGTPIVSYAANQLKNKSVIGTSEGMALAEFKNASNHFSDEVTKYYAGGQPAEAGRERVLANYDAAKSPQELYSALISETRLMHGASTALQDRFKNAQAGPRYNNAVVRDAIPNFPVISERAESGLNRITQGYIRAKELGKGGTATASPEVDRIKQKYGLQ
jgi:pantoate kinase